MTATKNETREAAIRLAIQQLNAATDVLTPHAADDRLIDDVRASLLSHLLFAVAELVGVGAQLAARVELQFEPCPPVAQPGHVRRLVADASDDEIEELKDAMRRADPPFDASAFERPEHSPSCLCTDCRAERERAGVVR